ncbi:MAG: hypothetical protein QGG95_01015 [Nitrospinota bacterium]|jgi:hypothetical protein|nr:hypothetical protein [Nitrospinota bacterium]|tara:strand:+ start:345 stop:593 length:249 start_codon:yes stop_codon:yes gene_type:complete
MKKILIISFLFLSFNAFGEAIHDWNPWSSIKKNSDDLVIKSIIVNSKNIGDARIFKEILGIKNLDDKKCILWFDGTEFCVFK